MVRTNIKKAFPDKSAVEQKRIEKAFYHNFCDLLLEAVKLFSISAAEIVNRCPVENPEIFEPFYRAGRDVIIAAGHCNSFELAVTGFNLQIPHQAVALYTPLANPFFDMIIKASRGKFGLQLLSRKKARQLVANHKSEPSATVFAIDQSPRGRQKPYWTTFLQQETGVQVGTEIYAKRLDAVVIYGVIKKIKRGYYSVHFQLVTTTPNELPSGAISEAVTRLLEQDILDDPASWFWTHKRWKRTKADYADFR